MSEEDVKWMHDTTGRFRRRPWYPQAYLDEKCEQILFEFLNELYGQITVPVPTGALIKLIERDAHELKLYADLTKVEEGLLGVTFFDPPAKPEVRIAGKLYRDPHGAHLVRFTLATNTSTCRFMTRSISSRGARSARSSAVRATRRWRSGPRWTGWNGRRTTPARPC